jgi:type I restriction enzyme R subunit
MSNFAFLYPAWGELFESATKAEALACPDPRAACFYARLSLEMIVKWLYRHESTLKLPYQDGLSALIHEPTFHHLVGKAVFAKSRIIKDLGNLAVHSYKPVRQQDALTAVRELFHVSFWLVRTYGKGERPDDGLSFDAALLPTESAVPKATAAQLQALAEQAEAKDAELKALRADKAALDQALAALQAEFAAIKAANGAKLDRHDYDEATTRDFFIDLLLKEAGWPLDQTRDREYPVTGMPNGRGQGFVDYVLWGDDDKPLAVVEAKRAKKDPRVGQRQAELYADCLERLHGQRPLIFYTNGYEHWLWDDRMYPPRPVQGFLKKDELALRIQRRTTRQSLAATAIDGAIAGRYYQQRAIGRIGEAFEKANVRKALVIMATGAGKTRTVVALSKLLMACNWAKRVLFLADRRALVKQAVNAFKEHYPDAAPVNLVTEKATEGRVYVSTYPTMMKLIDETQDEARRFGVGHFDLIIIDEAHRSVYQKYRAIFEYFDALLVGLTATPKDEVDHNTYSLFDLETGVPTDVYGLDEAVREGFLVPPKAISVPLRFQREGIRYDDLSEAEKEQWDALDWGNEGDVPEEVDANQVNKWLFNIDTVDKVLEHLMTHGQKVAGGDRLGKTIVFAKNHDHAVFIAERFDANYPHLKGSFARVIDVKADYADTLIDDFSQPEKAPHIAISVDMMDTGIDVPAVVNLVFFKIVRSKTKFWQMVGRGTRKCDDLFGPGHHKQFFKIFDFCQNLEFFSQNPDTTAGSAVKSLSHRLFTSRLELIAELDRRGQDGVTVQELALRKATAGRLRDEVAAMSLDNFLVRPKRRWVERFVQATAWDDIRPLDHHDLATEVAGLPSGLTDDDSDAKQFDWLMLRLQVALLKGEGAYAGYQTKVREIAGALEEKASIPMVKAEMALIQEVQGDAFWEDVTTPILDNARQRLRALIRLIDKARRPAVYSDFEDEIAAGTEVGLPGLDTDMQFDRFRLKVRQFLDHHDDLLAVQKLRWNRPLNETDLQALQAAIIAEGVATADDLAVAGERSNGLGLFIRSLVGLDEQAAAEALGVFQSGKTLTPNQFEFLRLVMAHLVQNGFMDPKLLYGSPYTDLHPQGLDGIFADVEADRLVAVLAEIRQRAQVS